MIDFGHYRTRLIVAIAIAIALHEIILSLMRGPGPSHDTESEAQTTRIVFETPRPTATPRPTPKPTPTPPPVTPTPEPRVTPPPRSTPAPVQQIAGKKKGKPAVHHGGGAHKAIAKAAHGTYANPRAAGAGTGTSTGQGSGNVPGNGGGLGGNGTGDTGTGNGAVNANTPCGFVEFQPTGQPGYQNGTAYEPVKANVTFPDGHRESVNFPYKWVYPEGERNDPWSNTNLKNNPNAEVPLQTPPPNADVSSFPPLIQYILKHSDRSGFTLLPPCGKNRG